VQVAVGSEGLWQRFATAIGVDAAQPRFAINRERVAHRDELIAVIEEHFASHPAEHWLQLLHDVGVPAGKVRTLDDVYAWDQVLSQGLLLEVEHPVHGPLRLPGSPLRLDDNPWSGGRSEHTAPPMLGEHNASIRAWLDEA
jgi:crotonobetainyl-CoA:carnitine CoA-transferase CaiB-like acyl-CoA transferase